uniref:Uncharacterized protein n=1 Tax=Trichogramma kaykai TaxID=54128 RepID=A0ABD2XIC2_9HYME
MFTKQESFSMDSSPSLDMLSKRGEEMIEKLYKKGVIAQTHAKHGLSILPIRTQLTCPFLHDVLTSCQRSSFLRSSRSQENINTTIKYFPIFKLHSPTKKKFQIHRPDLVDFMFLGPLNPNPGSVFQGWLILEVI